MKITLRVISLGGEAPPQALACDFGESGGTIGRAASSHLVLSDPARLISRLHARVIMRDGGFALVDQGHNPSIVNGRPLGRGQSAPICSGDILQIGAYRIMAVAHTDAANPATAVAVAAAPPATEVPPRSASRDELAQAFLSGLGATNLDLSEGVTPELMEHVGRLLREATQGTLELLLARAAIKRELRADLTLIAGRGNNPLKFAPDLAAALGHLIGPPRRGFMAPVDAMQQAYHDLRSHQFAVLAGLRVALTAVLRRFDPQMLESQLPHMNFLDRLLPMRRRARLWQIYRESHRRMLDAADDEMQALFGSEFACAYEDSAARLRADGVAHG